MHVKVTDTALSLLNKYSKKMEQNCSVLFKKIYKSLSHNSYKHVLI